MAIIYQQVRVRSGRATVDGENADVTPPNTPTLTVGTPTQTTIPLSCTAVSDGDPSPVVTEPISGVASYRFEGRPAGGSYSILPNDSERAATYQGLTAGQLYDVRCSAFDVAGNQSSFSEQLNVQTQTAGAWNEVNIPSLSVGTVRTYLNNAQSGDKLILPDGQIDWNESITWNAPGNVWLAGAGNLTVRGGGDGTVIRDTRGSGDGQPIFTVNTSSGNLTRISGISFVSVNRQVWNGLVAINGFSHNFRMDHCRLDVTGTQFSSCGRFNGDVWGVVDNCLLQASSTNNGIQVHHQNWGGLSSSDDGNASWADEHYMGTERAVYVEDCTYSTNFFNGYINDTSGGGRQVIRKCILNWGAAQTHSTGHDSFGDRGGRVLEVYENEYTNPSGSPLYSNSAYTSVYLTSGTGVIWGNIYINNARTQNFLVFKSNRHETSTYTQQPVPNGWGYAGTTLGPSAWDQNSDSTGYAVLDQIGRGKGDLLVNPFPAKINQASGTQSWPNQAAEPIYEWLNGWQGPSDGGGNYLSNGGYGSIQANRDYYLYNDSFNGSSGCGAGLLSARPTGGLTVGVGYFATDVGAQGTLYRATSATTWEVYYQPYTYPHPLRSA